jgi:hypothetical protein
MTTESASVWHRHSENIGLKSRDPGAQAVKQLSEHEAYCAMYAFLEIWYGRSKSAELANLLGSMSLLPDGTPADPALGEDWATALEAVAAGAVDARLRLR